MMNSGSKNSQKMSDKQKKVGFTFILTSVLLIVIVLTFTGGLIFSSFQKDYSNSTITNYAVSGNDTVRKIEYAVKYGKPLENFYGIEEMLLDKKQQLQQVENIFIATTSGDVVYDTEGPVIAGSISEDMMEAFLGQKTSELSHTYDHDDGHYFVFLPISTDEGDWTGSMVIQIQENVLQAPITMYMWEMIYQLVILAIGAAVVLAFIEYKFPFVDENGKVRKKRLLIALIIILSSVQAIFGFNNYQQFSNAYIDLANNNASFASATVQRDVESVVEKGVTYEKLFDLESYLDEIVLSVDELAHIQVEYGERKDTYNTGGEDFPEGISDEFIYQSELAIDSKGQQAFTKVVLSEEYYNNRMREIILDTLTIIVTSFLFMVEVTIFILLFLNRRFKKKATNNEPLFEGPDEQEQEKITEKDESSIIRPLAFLFAMAIFMSASFIPIVMNDLYTPILGLSRELVLGLPITTEMFFAGLGSIVAGFFIDKKGWKPVFIIGVICFMIGSLLSGLASSPIEFIGARGVVGIGYGFGLMALRGYINSAKTETGRTGGFASFFAGLYAGLNIGVIVGAMLADRIGFYNVFFVAFAISLLSCLFAFTMIQNRTINNAVEDTTQQRSNLSEEKIGNKSALSSIKGFLLNKKVLALFLLIIVPTTICSMFLDYYLPVFADNAGVSTSNVGRAFLINGIIIVYLAPLLSKIVSKYVGVEKSIVLSGIIIVIGLSIFASQGTLLAVFIAVVLLGIAESFGLVAQNNYFVRLKATKQLGTGKALGFYDNIRKLGQMAGPMAFGGLAFLGIFGVGVIAAIALLGIIIFYFVSRPTTGIQYEEGNA